MHRLKINRAIKISDIVQSSKHKDKKSVGPDRRFFKRSSRKLFVKLNAGGPKMRPSK